ncbi:MAG: ketoacyl-ACP synthase III [Candidatus Marinimicrobia bacterium]|nr:ketoacyl-ACP synthase III [Candidatus Neomarinimicrobiota bacterium]
MRYSRITGVGFKVPDRTITNDDLAGLMDTSDEWIVSRSGIKERHWVEEGEGTSDLSVEAAKQAMEMAGIQPEDIDLVVVGSLTSDYFFPGVGAQLQDKLGLRTVGSFDVKAACSAFVYSLSIGDQFIKTGQYDTILVVGAEVQSTALNVSNEGRDMAVLFGDGAGAAILQPAEDESRVLSTHMHSEGKYLKELWCEGPASLYHPRISHEHIDAGIHLPSMNGREVFKNAIKRFPEVINEALDANNLSLRDVKLIIPHQANLRISQAVAKKLGVSMDMVYSNIHKYGNTTGASIPIAMTEAYREGRFKKGDIIILAAFGAGFTWASAAIRW